jgi:hypothetical protein
VNAASGIRPAGPLAITIEGLCHTGRMPLAPALARLTGAVVISEYSDMTGALPLPPRNLDDVTAALQVEHRGRSLTSVDFLRKARRAYQAVTMAKTASTTVAIDIMRFAPKKVRGAGYARPGAADGRSPRRAGLVSGRAAAPGQRDGHLRGAGVRR